MFRTVAQPFVRFFQLEAASGILLFAVALLALAWANSAWAEWYHELFSLPISVRAGGLHGEFTLHELINDGLMTVFFFVVGLEIKRELAFGELRTFSRAVLPAIAALGGMLVPAVIYALFNQGTPWIKGWGIPMATDIAFCVACMSLLGKRVPYGLVVFLTALAIFDDLGGIIVIALFYGHGLDLVWLASVGLVTLGLYGFNRLFVRSGWLWALGGVALWWSLHHAGIHATISGVVLAMMVPARPQRALLEVLSGLKAYVDGLLAKKSGDEALLGAEVLHIEEALEDLEAPLNRFVHLLQPLVAFVIMPLFALANSGVDLRGVSISDLSTSIPLGTALGLFLGKQLGIFSFTAASVKLGLGTMPGGSSWAQLYGTAIIAGIGFTVALFVATLAFPAAPQALNQAKMGILAGSLVSGVIGYTLLRAIAPRGRLAAAPAGEPSTYDLKHAGR